MFKRTFSLKKGEVLIGRGGFLYPKILASWLMTNLQLSSDWEYPLGEPDPVVHKVTNSSALLEGMISLNKSDKYSVS